MKKSTTSVAFSAADLLRLCTKDSLEDQFHAQQGAYMRRKGLDTPPVKPAKIRRYARLCVKGLKANLKVAKHDPKAMKRLFKAYSRRTKLTSKEFLLAAA